MHKLHLAVITFALLFSASAIAQTNGTTDPCANIACSSSATTCPDGYVASCQNTCSNGVCSQCTPSCEGHTSSGSSVSSGQINVSGISCPFPPSEPTCQSGYFAYKITDDKGCITGYECKKSDIVCGNKVCEEGEASDCVGTSTSACYRGTCPSDCEKTCPQIAPPSPDSCPNGYYKPKYDSSSCIVGYECVPSAGACSNEECGPAPGMSNYVCPDGKTTAGPGKCIRHSDGRCGWEIISCPTEANLCGNLKCDAGETAENCPGDCIPTGRCPATIACPDGSTAFCKQADYGCTCEQCPLAQLPPGCVQEKDEKGFLRVVCVQKCGPPPKEVFDKCRNAGGNPIVKTGVDSCQFIDCQFGEDVKNPLVGALQCPRPGEVDEGMKKCELNGLRGVVAFEGGCRIPRCITTAAHTCQFIPEDERRKIVESCQSQGQHIYKDFDGNGCPVLRCATPDTCRKDAPEELFRKCGERGGHVVIKRDENACIVFADCVQRGDPRDAFVEGQEQIPDTTRLLKLAFDMEDLRIEFDKLARDASNIADYYKSVNSNDEERYRRAAGMFESARDKVDEIRTKLKERLDSLTKEDMLEIRSDIRYIKEVMLKDILYVMLSDDEELEDIEKSESEDCGHEGSCFDHAFRLCKPITFKPEGVRGPTIEIVGLEDKKCVLKARLPEGGGPPPGALPGINPPYEMTCRIPDYALGMRGPQDIIPYCEGSMAELMKRFGGPASSAGHEFPPPEGGPGGCKTIPECTEFCINNYDACVQWTKEHPAYGQPPSMEELRRFKESGYHEGQYAASGFPEDFEGPGGCSSPEECERYCKANYEECRTFFQGIQAGVQQGIQAGVQQGIQAGIQQGIQGGLQQGVQQGVYQGYQQGFQQGAYQGESCRGCFDNGVCDSGECSYCRDCQR